jgi:hypothetical protein
VTQPQDEDGSRFTREQDTSRETGGVPNDEMPDQGSTTGTTPSEEFVGRVAGEDTGYEEETGAERRAREEGDGS